jgi:hypothetical protein
MSSRAENARGSITRIAERVYRLKLLRGSEVTLSVALKGNGHIGEIIQTENCALSFVDTAWMKSGTKISSMLKVEFVRFATAKRKLRSGLVSASITIMKLVRFEDFSAIPATCASLA